jgi:hypothetical protein
MKKLLFLFTILYAIEGQSQVKIGVFIQPSVNFANWENSWICCSEGIVANIKVYKPLSFIFGIGFQAKKYDVSHLGYENLDSPLSTCTQHTLPISFIPRIDLEKLGKSFHFYWMTGTTLNLCLYNKIDYFEDQQPASINSTIRFQNILLNIGFGFEYTISRFSIFLEPAFNTTLARNRNAFIPYSNTVSLNAGCYYRI